MSKVAYFDCFSGISGDMIIAALLDAGLDISILEQELQKLDLSGFKLERTTLSKQNIAATHFKVVGVENPPLRHLSDLTRIVERSRFEPHVVERAKEIFLKIAKAEAKIHSQPLEDVHFHEIGAIDTIVDVVGALVALEVLAIEKVFASKLNVGSGFVEFSHGRFPVPAPATAEILKNVPTYATESNAELVTPTGAAIITTVAEEFTTLPVMRSQSVGYGAGTQDLPHPNVLRVFLGENVEDELSGHENVTVLEATIDDMNPELYGHVAEKLLEQGALDVFLSQVLMKKGRPGINLTVLCKPEIEAELVRLIFHETTSLGVRRRRERRHILEREVRRVECKFGTISVKVSSLNGKIVNQAPEYEECRQVARENKVPLKDVYREVTRALSGLT